MNYKFKNEELFENALRHSSYAHECKDSKITSNERLEFLGDAVLELAISSYIYNKYPELPEGELTKLRASIVCEETLAKQAKKLDLGSMIKLGKGEENTGGRNRDSLIADAYESVIGAIFLDGGFHEAEKFILEEMNDAINEHRQSFKKYDCKTYLQEVIQSFSKEPLHYEIVEESGPAHEKRFIVEVRHRGEILGRGTGKSKKEAEQNAASIAVKKYENEKKLPI